MYTRKQARDRCKKWIGWKSAMNKEVSEDFEGQEQTVLFVIDKAQTNAFVAGLCAFLQEKDALLACENHCHHFEFAKKRL